jgi:hypothetical protein
MAKAPEPHGPIEPGQTDHFRGLLQRRGVNDLACPACGQNTWGGFVNAAINITDAPGSNRGVGTIRTLAAVCAQCGYVAMFDREVLDG